MSPKIAGMPRRCYRLSKSPQEDAMRGWRLSAVTMTCLLVAGPALAAELRAEIKQTTPTGTGDSLGTVTISDGSGGAAVKTALKGLPPGPHGFHVHQNGSCQPTTANNQPVPAGAAGGHYDPQNTGKHEGPEGSGHLGDLPLLQVGQDGNANQNLTAPHIKDLAGLKGKAVVIHAGGDNYSDQPQPLGGGGGRIACGILE
jgi:Cu-Zn family superoxide dismutase